MILQKGLVGNFFVTNISITHLTSERDFKNKEWKALVGKTDTISKEGMYSEVKKKVKE